MIDNGNVLSVNKLLQIVKGFSLDILDDKIGLDVSLFSSWVGSKTILLQFECQRQEERLETIERREIGINLDL